MQFSTILFLTTFFTSALAAPVKQHSISSVPTKRGEKPECDEATEALIESIKDNLKDLYEQLDTAKELDDILSSSPFDEDKFDSAQGALLGLFNKATTMEQNSQKIAPAGNAAIPGLMNATAVQIKGLGLLQGLKGVKGDDSDIEEAKDKVEELIEDIKDDIEENKENLEDVSLTLE
jgi:DNA-binding ferritin-like protein